MGADIRKSYLERLVDEADGKYCSDGVGKVLKLQYIEAVVADKPRLANRFYWGAYYMVIQPMLDLILADHHTSKTSKVLHDYKHIVERLKDDPAKRKTYLHWAKKHNKHVDEIIRYLQHFKLETRKEENYVQI